MKTLNPNFYVAFLFLLSVHNTLAVHSDASNSKPLFFLLPAKIVASCQDFPSYLASAQTVHDLLLPVETAVRDKRILPSLSA